MRKNMKHGLWSGKKRSRDRRKEDMIDFDDLREEFFGDEYDDDYRDDYDERDYAEDDDYYSDDYDDVDRYEDDRRGGRRRDDRYEDDRDYRDDRYEDERDYRDDDRYADEGGYRDDDRYEEDEYYRDDDADYRDDERYEDERDYRDDDRYEDDRDYREDNRYEDNRDYRDEDRYEDEERYADEEDDRYADEEDDRYEDDARYEDEERYADEEDNRYEDDRDYRDDDRYADEEDDRYVDEERYADEEDRYADEDEERYADEEEDRYDDDRDYRDDDARYEDEDRYEDDRYEDDERDYDGEYGDDYSDEYYEDDYEYDRYDDEDDDRYAPVGARRNERSTRGSKKSKKAKASKAKANKKKKNRDGKDNVFAGFIKFVANTSAVERTAAAVAIVLLAGGITTAVFFAGVVGKNRAIGSFAEVGSNMEQVEIVGQSGLVAMADSEKSKSMTAEIVVDSEEEEIVPDDAAGVTINMNLTTIKSDMKIKFVNSKTNKLVASVPFKVSVVTPDGSTITYDDDDKDGIIYKKDLKAGKYKVTPNALPSEYSKYNVDTSTKTLTVKDTVEMKAVDVSNEVKKESQVNAAKEDTAVKTQVESQLKDTVEWVESTKTPVDGAEGDGDYKYEKIDNSTIVNPIKFSFANGTFYKTALFFVEGEGTPDDSGTETSKPAASSEASTQPKEKTQEEIDAEEAAKKAKEEADRKQKEQEEAEKEKQRQQEEAEKQKQKEEADRKAKEEAEKKANKERILVDGKENSCEYSLEPGKTQAINITDGENQKINSLNIKIKDEQIATLVNGNTIKAGNKEGSTTITLSIGEYKANVITVNVKKPASKELSVGNIVTVGANVVVTPNVQGNGKAVNYTLELKNSGDSAYLQIVDKKSVKGIKPRPDGNPIEVVIKSDGYNPTTVKFPVRGKMTNNFGNNKEMKVGDVFKGLKAFDCFDADMKSALSGVGVKVNNTNIVTYKDGNITAVAPGKATITLTLNNYENCDININVTGKAKGELVYKNMTLMEGKKVTLTENEVKGVSKLKLTSNNTKIVKIDGEKGIYPVAKGDAEVTVEGDGTKLGVIKVHVLAKSDPLKDNKDRPLYFKDKDGKFKAATLADYDPKREFYTRAEGKVKYKYTGWQTIDGKTYFYTKDHEYVTGEQVIQGVKYTFSSEGVLQNANGGRGIDVSKWNGSIDWKAVKNEGIEFVIIRCGYRGSSEGALIEDPMFRTNIKGAQAAGLKVGIYFFTQAVNEVEAVEEASMAINLAKGYGLSYPIYLDVEGSNGRGDGISASQRTANIKAFCGTVQNAGYKAGVYANKTWFNEKINTGSLTNYKIWLAQYASSPTYSATRYDMWQYTSKGRVSGISGNVDLNICYR